MGDRKTWAQCVSKAEKIIAESKEYPVIKIAKGVIPCVGIFEAITGEDILTGAPLTPEERVKAALSEAVGVALPSVLRRLRG